MSKSNIFTSDNARELTEAIKDKLDTKASKNHDHDDEYYTQEHIDAELAKKSNTGHTHSEFLPSNALNDYAKSSDVTAEINNNNAHIFGLINEKAESIHTHTKSEITNFPTKLSEFTNDSGYLTQHQPLTNYVTKEEKGAKGGVATLDDSGKVPSSQLPSYVDDVLEYDSLSNFPAAGESGKIYVSTQNNKTYRWSGSDYIEISQSLALGTTSSTAYYGDKGKTAYDHSQSTHAPVNAQKNSDITKAEIEAKLTGNITSHTHSNMNKEAYIEWGGRNISAGFSPIDAALVPELGANRLAFMPPEAITIQYSTNGGSTWSDYSTSDGAKVQLFSGLNTSFYIGGAPQTGVDKTNHRLRIIINTGAANVYTILTKFVIYLATNGSTGCTCTIDVRTEQNRVNNVDAWEAKASNTNISGWTGYNVINVGGITTYGNTPSTQYGQIRFTFAVTGHNQAYGGLFVMSIQGFGGVGWNTPSTMAKYGRIFTYDWNKNVTFPANLSATTLIENGTSLVSKYAAKTHTHNQYLTAHQPLTNYYTKDEVNTELGKKANSSHSHSNYLTSHQSLADYYNKTELNQMISNISASLDEKVSKNGDSLLGNLTSNYSISAKSFTEDGTTLSNKYQEKGNYFKNIGWWNLEDTHNASDLINGIVFAYSNHTGGTGVNGTLVDFAPTQQYRFQMQSRYGTADIYTRARNGDTGTWTSWKKLAFASDIPSIAAWAKAANKPTYVYSEVGAAAANHTHEYVTETILNSAISANLGPLVAALDEKAAANHTHSGYLTTSGTAANSSKLNNQAASYYLNYNNLSNKPTIPTVSNATITIKQTGKSDQTFTLNGSAATISLNDNNTTYSNATTSAAGLMSTSDKTKLDGIESGAQKNSSITKAEIESKLTGSISSHTHNNVLLTINTTDLWFRGSDTNYASGLSYRTSGNEAVCFENKSSSTSWIFATKNPNRTDSGWSSVVPSLQIKNQKVTINKLIADGTQAAYNLDVNGTANATTIYENGTALSSKYASTSHTHDDRYYTESEVNNKIEGAKTELRDEIGNKADSGHTHDSRYYTESEIDTKLSAKANSSHSHSGYASSSHTHDDRYYTESEINTKLSAKANSSHTHTGYQIYVDVPGEERTVTLQEFLEMAFGK